MSRLETRWVIDGISAAFITRNAANGHYCVIFERENASIEQIEKIHWEQPSILRLMDCRDEPCLPEGCAFALTDLRYQHSGRLFTAEVAPMRPISGR